MTVYSGARTMDGIKVVADGAPLDPRYDLKRLSRGGFEWTYEGAAPAQLSLALLAHHLGDDRRALAAYEAFMREVVADLETDWVLSGADIDKALEALENEA